MAAKLLLSGRWSKTQCYLHDSSVLWDIHYTDTSAFPQFEAQKLLVKIWYCVLCLLSSGTYTNISPFLQRLLVIIWYFVQCPLSSGTYKDISAFLYKYFFTIYFNVLCPQSSGTYEDKSFLSQKLLLTIWCNAQQGHLRHSKIYQLLKKVIVLDLIPSLRKRRF